MSRIVNNNFFQKLGMSVASLTFGVALLTFIFAASSGKLTGTSSHLLYITSFLLMLRFWWRYTELFVKFAPSDSYFDFLFDFPISFFGILAVLYINNIQIWTVLGAGAMIFSMIRCGLSWSDIEKKNVKKRLKNTLYDSLLMLLVFGLIYIPSSCFEATLLTFIIFIIVFFFVVISSTIQNN